MTIEQRLVENAEARIAMQRRIEAVREEFHMAEARGDEQACHAWSKAFDRLDEQLVYLEFEAEGLRRELEAATRVEWAPREQGRLAFVRWLVASGHMAG